MHNSDIRFITFLLFVSLHFSLLYSSTFVRFYFLVIQNQHVNLSSAELFVTPFLYCLKNGFSGPTQEIEHKMKGERRQQNNLNILKMELSGFVLYQPVRTPVVDLR